MALPMPMQKFQCESYDECNEWFNLFKAFDSDNDGYIPAAELKDAIRNSAYTFGLNRSEAENLIFNVDENKDEYVDFPEFSSLMAKAKKLQLRRFILYAARSVLSKSQQADATRYLLEYNCFPPPIFLVVISILQFGLYIYQDFVYCGDDKFSAIKCTPTNSPLILNPCRKQEVWRYFSYMFVHVGFVHLLTNLSIQIMLGIPLELVHKWWRIGLIYLLGVMSGSLLFFVFDRNVYLAGASGGVYTLLSAHIANVIINWGEMELNWIRAIVLGVFVGADMVVSLYNRYVDPAPNKISYVSHIGGFIAGLFLGIVVLRNLRKLEWETYAWWTALAVFIIFVCACVAVIIGQEITLPISQICSQIRHSG